MSTASKRLNEVNDGWTGRRLNFDHFSQQLARRRAEIGEVEVPRNSGARRSASKRALLKAIEDAGGKW